MRGLSVGRGEQLLRKMTNDVLRRQWHEEKLRKKVTARREENNYRGERKTQVLRRARELVEKLLS